MAIEAARIVIKIDTNAPKATREMRELETYTDDAGDAAKRTTGKFDALVSVGIAAFATAAVTAMGRIGTSLLNAASDAEEVRNKFDVVFRDQSDAVEQWASDFSDAVGRSTTENMGFLATIQDTLVPLGLARNAAADMSMSVVELATDLSSFNNLPTEQVIQDIQSALVGNTETLRKYGVVANQAEIIQEALTSGLISTADELDATTKAQAIYQLIVAGTSDAQGDALNTADSYANRLRALQATTKDAAEAFGAALLPAATDVVETITNAVRWFADLDEGTKEIIITAAAAVTGMAALAAGIAGVNAAMTILAANPIVAVIAGTTALVAIVAKAVSNIETMEDRIDQLPSTMREYGQSIEDVLGPMEDLSEIEELGPERYQQLIDKYPELTGEIDAYTTSVKEAAKQVARLAYQEYQTVATEIFSEWYKASEIALEASSLLATAEENLPEAVAAGYITVERASENLEILRRDADETSAVARELWRQFRQVGEDALESFNMTTEAAEETATALGGDGGDGGVAGAAERLDNELLKVKLQAIATAEQTGKLKAAVDDANESLSETNAVLQDVEGNLLGVADAMGEVINIVPGWTNLSENLSEAKTIVEALPGVTGEVGEAMDGVIPKFEEWANTVARVLSPKAEEWGEITKEAAEKGSDALTEQQEKLLLLQIEYENTEQSAFDAAAAEKQAAIDVAQALDEKAQAAEDAARQQAQAAFDLAAAEKQAAADVTAKVREERQKQIDAALEMVPAIGDFISGIGDFWSAMYARQIADAEGNEAEQERIRRRQVIAEKAFAIAEATISTAVSVAKVIWNPPLAALVGALGAAQIAAIIATPIPGAELGGSFVVPPGNNNDGGLVRVNSGEQVDVTPARRSGDSGGMPSTVVVRISEREFAGAVEDAFNRGGAQIRRQGAVRVSR